MLCYPLSPHCQNLRGFDLRARRGVWLATVCTPCSSHPPVALCHSSRGPRLPAFLCYPSSMELQTPISWDGLPGASSHSIQSFKLSSRRWAQRFWLATPRHFLKEGLQTTLGQWVVLPPYCPSCFLYLTSSSPGKLSVQKRRWMVAGAAGAPGLLAARALSRGGESAIILHLRMEVPPVQEKMCRPSLAEGRWAQAGTDAADVTTCTDHRIKTSCNWEKIPISMDFFFVLIALRPKTRLCHLQPTVLVPVKFCHPTTRC